MTTPVFGNYHRAAFLSCQPDPGRGFGPIGQPLPVPSPQPVAAAPTKRKTTLLRPADAVGDWLGFT